MYSECLATVGVLCNEILWLLNSLGWKEFRVVGLDYLTNNYQQLNQGFPFVQPGAKFMAGTEDLPPTLEELVTHS